MDVSREENTRKLNSAAVWIFISLIKEHDLRTPLAELDSNRE